MRLIRILAGLLAAAALACPALSAVRADEGGADDPRLKLPPPSFRPGASVTWELELRPPPGWHINYLVPLVVAFDSDDLKGLPVLPGQLRYEFTLEDYQRSYTALIPLAVAPKAGDGEYTLPARVDCGICTEDNSACTFAEAQASVVLRVRAAAPKSEKNQAQPKGILQSVVALLQSE